MNTKVSARYFFFGLLLLTMFFTGAILWPYLTILVLAASAAVVLSPIRRWFARKIPWQKEWLAPLLTLITFIILFCGPLVLIGIAVFNQSTDIYSKVSEYSAEGTYVTDINAAIAKYLPGGMTFDVQSKIGDLTGIISTNLARIFTTTLNTVLSFLLFMLATFYFLKDGEQWKKAAVILSPLPPEDDNKVITRLHDAVNGVVRGYLLIAVAQGILMGVGLAIFGVPNAVLFGFLAGIASLIPSIGTALVAVPAIIFLFATGQTNAGIGFAIWAAALVGSIDNVLSPIFVGRRIQIPPLFILFSVLGGIVMMGPVGILIGPLTLSLLYALLAIYKSRTFDHA